MVKVLEDPFVQEAIKRILRGARNGAVYGGKVRFAHALVMAVLFGRGTWDKRIRTIIQATIRHAWLLARFVFLYKSLLLAQALFNKHRRDAALGTAAAATSSEAFIAGAVGGYLVFGKDPRPVAEQVVLYLISRVLVGGARHTFKNTSLGQPNARAHAWSMTAALAWGLVMYLFHVDQKALHFSLAKSMEYLYIESDGIANFATFLDIL